MNFFGPLLPRLQPRTERRRAAAEAQEISAPGIFSACSARSRTPLSSATSKRRCPRNDKQKRGAVFFFRGLSLAGQLLCIFLELLDGQLLGHRCISVPSHPLLSACFVWSFSFN